MADLATSLDDLIAQLNPDRDYGRPFEDVLRDVRDGALVLSPGAGRQPLIQEAGSGVFVKGTGRRPGSQEYKYNSQQVAQLLSAHLPEVLPAFIEDLMEKRDPRMFKIFFERVAGNAGQPFGGMEAGEVVEMMKVLAGMSDSVPIRPEPIDVGDL